MSTETFQPPPPLGPLVTVDTDVAVIGGSIAGLAIALFCASRGLRVTVVDRDAAAAPKPVDEPLRRAPRWTTPQSAHSHAFLSRAFQILRDERPDLLVELTSAGVHTMSLPEQQDGRVPPDDGLMVMLSRRTTFEAVFRQVAAADPQISYHAEAEVAQLRLAATRTGTPKVIGADLTDGARLNAKVTVDATGRRGDVNDWLRASGVTVATQDTDCGIAYHTRFYRLRFGQTWGPLNRGYTGGSSFDRYSCLVFPGDGEAFSITFGVLPKDRSLKGLRKAEGFQAAAEQLEVVREWVDPARAEPISDVHSMTRMRNRLHRLHVDGEPTVTGIVALADAAGISNPAHSRGCSLALWHAQRMATSIAAHLDDPVALARARDAALEDVIAPWVEDSRLQDAARLSRWDTEAGIEAPTTPPGTVTNGEAYVAAHHDPVVWHAFTRLQQLLVGRPEEVLADPEVVRRVRATQAEGLGLPALAGPSHDELAALVDAAVADAAPSTGRDVAAHLVGSAG